MMLPEEYGGAGASCTDCAVVFEELGRGPLPGPYFSSGVLAAEIILAGGSPAQKKTLLPEICNGRAIVIPALSDDPIQWGPRSVQTRLTKTISGFALNGTKRFVYDGDAATSFICAARTETGGVVLALVDRNAPRSFGQAGFGLHDRRRGSPLRQCGDHRRQLRRRLGSGGTRAPQGAADSLRL